MVWCFKILFAKYMKILSFYKNIQHFCLWSLFCIFTNKIYSNYVE